MKRRLFLLFTLFLSLTGMAQVLWHTALSDSINETSGLITFQGRLISHNDSGGAPHLYELDSVSGHIIRTVVVKNASNVDWEDLAIDSSYLYIADIGNNDGSRRNLKVYRVKLDDYLQSKNDSVDADSIIFNYADQTQFTPTPFATNHDDEALVSLNDSLYIFTKNWKNQWTNIYALPKDTGNFTIIKKDSLNVQGLVTGASLHSPSNTLFLSGYTLSYPIIVKFSPFNPSHLSSGKLTRLPYSFPSNYTFQVEGTSTIDQRFCHITVEGGSGKPLGLMRLDTEYNMSMHESKEAATTIFPNPANDVIYISERSFEKIYIMNNIGEILVESHISQIDVSTLQRGFYYATIIEANRVVTTMAFILE